MSSSPPVGVASSSKSSSTFARRNQQSHASPDDIYRSNTLTPQPFHNAQELRRPESIGPVRDIDDFVDAYYAQPVVQDLHEKRQPSSRSLTHKFSTPLPSPQLHSPKQHGATSSFGTRSSSLPSRPASSHSSNVPASVLTPPMSAFVAPSISSGRSTRNNSIDSKSSRPKFLPTLHLNSSTSSVSSFSSIQSTSSNSPLYMFKKPPMDLELPFSNPKASASDVEEFMKIIREQQEGRKRGAFGQNSFKGFWIAFVVCVIYFVFVGLPLWDGLVLKVWKIAHDKLLPKWGLIPFLVWGALLTWLPLMFGTFEGEVDDTEKRDASETCLVIPAYKAADALRDTIPHALKIFKPEQIFIIANGNSPTPLDNTEDVCKEFGVNHFWVPVGSKIVAEFVGVFLAKKYKYCLLTDDDVHLPPNLPIVTNRINGKTACVGYSIKSTGANGSKGTVFQQAQDVEYKLAGMSKVFQSKYGSAVFPHGAIILWDRKILEKLFFGHPGYHISEDWYFGHTARSAGFRVDFCSQVFVETETPPCLFIPSKSSRGGYGEMTIWKQRFYRWNFFFIYRLTQDLSYMLFAWRLGWRELITKLFVFEEVYGTIIYIMRPIMLPIMLVAAWRITLIATFGLLGVYILGFIFFNAFHLRRKGEMIAWKILPVYFGMKMALVFVNTASVYYSLYAYAKFFSVRHSRVVEKYEALDALKGFLEKEAEKEMEMEMAQSIQTSDQGTLKMERSVVS